MHASTDERTLFDVTLPALHGRLRSIVTGVEEVAYDFSTFATHGVVGNVSIPDGYIAAFEDSPMVLKWRHDRCDATLHLAQMESRSAFHRTLFYNITARHMGFEDQLIATFETLPGIAINCSVQRDLPFSEGERFLIDHVRHHLRACVRRLRPPSGAVRRVTFEQVRYGPEQLPIEIPDAVRRLLSEYFPSGRASLAQGRLPEEVRSWIRSSHAHIKRQPPPGPLRFLRKQGVRGAIVIRLFPAYSSPGGLLRFTEEWQALQPDETFPARHLTRREREVLTWISQGKRNGEIGMILGCTERTVEKHVENLLRKIGATSRHSAMQLATKAHLR